MEHSESDWSHDFNLEWIISMVVNCKIEILKGVNIIKFSSTNKTKQSHLNWRKEFCTLNKPTKVKYK